MSDGIEREGEAARRAEKGFGTQIVRRAFLSVFDMSEDLRIEKNLFYQLRSIAQWVGYF